MKKELEIAVVTAGDPGQKSRRLYQRHLREGIPYVELRKGKKYGEIWFETPSEIPFSPRPVFHLREWYESYWLERKEHRGLHPYKFSMGPTAVWFKFTLSDLDIVKKQLTRLTWESVNRESKRLPQIRTSSDRRFWRYAEQYFEKSRAMKRKIGQRLTLSGF